MSPEKPPSIMCDVCGGWHPTEAHTQYEKEARETRMAEIKARPDSAYRFETLGFTSEQKNEVEPWMHEVIERAKELGDDLQDSDNFLHMEMSWGQGEDRLLKMVRDSLFAPHPLKHHDGRGNAGEKIVRGGHLNVRPHNAGMTFERWGFNDIKKDILVAQERFVQTRSDEDLEAYKKVIREAIVFFGLTSEKDNPLQTTGERKRVVTRLISNPKYGIILSFPDKIKDDPDLSVEHNKVPAFSDEVLISDKKTKHTLIEYPDLSQRHYDPDIFHDRGRKTQPETVIPISGERDIEGVDEEVLSRLSNYVLNGIYASGVVEDQQEILRKMIETTKDHPERRLPIYNFYGKLVWPRPPKQEQETESGSQ